MRHRVVSSKFGRSTAHRKALLANLVCALIAEKRIKTTLRKAKATQQLAEKMVTLAKRRTLAARRKAVAVLRQKQMVKLLFDEIAPQCQDRVGGYVRVLKLGPRQSDGSDMAMVEWLNIRPVDKKKKPVSKEDEKKE